MKIIDTMDYPTLLWMQQQPQWKEAVSKCTYSGLRDGINCEGMAGYIEVKVELEVYDIEAYAKLYNSKFDDDIEVDVMKLRAKVLGMTNERSTCPAKTV